MNDNLWNLELTKIEQKELTDKELEIAKECAEIELEFEDIIKSIRND